MHNYELCITMKQNFNVLSPIYVEVFDFWIYIFLQLVGHFSQTYNMHIIIHLIQEYCTKFHWLPNDSHEYIRFQKLCVEVCKFLPIFRYYFRNHWTNMLNCISWTTTLYNINCLLFTLLDICVYKHCYRTDRRTNFIVKDSKI